MSHSNSKESPAFRRGESSILVRLSRGKPEEAIAVTEQAHRMDPLSPVIGSSLGMILYLARRYDQALRVLHRAMEISPEHFLPHLRMGLVGVQIREL